MKPEKKMSNVNVTFRIFHNTHSKISPYRNNRFNIDRNRYIVTGEAYKWSCATPICRLLNVTYVPANRASLRKTSELKEKKIHWTPSMKFRYRSHCHIASNFPAVT